MLDVHLQLSIHMLDFDLQLTIHLQLAIYLHTGFPACMLDVCLIGELHSSAGGRSTAFVGGFLFLNLLLVTAKYSGDLENVGWLLMWLDLGA
jgi:hypothetical protein